MHGRRFNTNFRISIRMNIPNLEFSLDDSGRGFGVVAHPELVPKMFGQQIYRILILCAVLLHQISHGLDNQPLAFDVPRIRGTSLSPAAGWIRNNRDGKDSGHEVCFSVRTRRTVGHSLTQTQILTSTL